MTSKRLTYLPLGGAGEIGMNAYVYGYGAEGKERFILVDLGVTFPNMDTSPGVDLIFPDLAWLEARADRLDGIFITHGHEDHIGAIGHLWNRLRAPVHARVFTAELARMKMAEHGLDPKVLQVAKPWPEKVAAGPFEVSFLPVSHSIPESAGLVIDTPAGRVIHTGDFKLDLDPVVGEPFDRSLWAEVAAPGVKALVCDSTNVFSRHPGRSESALRPEITKFVGAQPGMVVATTFASNVARVKTLAEAGQGAGRSVCLLGRAMRRMIETAVKTGILADFPSTVSPEEARDIPRENLMLIVTGSQGERRAASAQLARGKYLGLEMKTGDTFLFSSKTIPGNERGVIQIMNAYSEKGVKVFDDEDGRYHVSGHPNRPDLEVMHNLIDPALVVPMHGEHRHLSTHVELAQSLGRKAALVPNGTRIVLDPASPEVVEYVETGRTYLDGSVQIGALDGVVRDRIRLALNGLVVVTLILDEEDEPVGEPWVEIMGLPQTGTGNTAVAEVFEADLAQFLGRADAKTLTDDDALEQGLKRVARKTAQDELGRKPEVIVVISRLG